MFTPPSHVVKVGTVLRRIVTIMELILFCINTRILMLITYKVLTNHIQMELQKQLLINLYKNDAHSRVIISRQLHKDLH